MNDWMCRKLQWDDSYRPDRGKVFSAEELEQLQRFSRYLDVDGDGIAARSLPGVSPKGGYFTRGSGHTKHATYTEDSAEYQEVVDRLARKLNNAAQAVPAPEFNLQRASGSAAPIGIISLGGCHGAVSEAVDRLRAGGTLVDYMRIRAFPFPGSVKTFIETHQYCYVVEQNRDGQLRTLLAIETGIARDSMRSILDYGGLPLTAETVIEACHPEPEQSAGEGPSVSVPVTGPSTKTLGPSHALGVTT
jgi:2-oxoglutarate ferredoxin oxidoreductase subunit alpha